jgi:hypothetical protein
MSNGNNKHKKNEKRHSQSHPPNPSHDNEADHIRENNEAPLSPELIKWTLDLTSPNQNHPQHEEKHKSASGKNKKKNKIHHHHHHHHHRSDAESAGDLAPPSVPNLTDAIISVGDSDPDSKLPYREQRRRRQQEQQQTHGDDASGFLDDILAEDDEHQNGQELVPGAYRINMDGHETDDDLEIMEKNSARTGARSSEFFASSEFKKGHHHKRKSDGGSQSATRQHFSSGEMATLPQAEHVTAMLIDGQDPEDFRKMAEKDAEKAILAKMPAADIVGSKDEIEKRRRRVWTWSILGIVALLLVVVGVVVGMIGAQSRNNTGPETAVDPTTFDNITSTEDLCQNAVPLDFPTIVTGSTVDAASDTSLFGVCGDVARNGFSGVWYSLRGSGTILSLSTCYGSSFDTQVSVFRGSSCSFATCVEGSDQRTNCGTDGSYLTFLAEEGENYFILIHGLRRANGVFTLVIEEVKDTSRCSSAAIIVDSNPKGEVTVFGSTKYSMIDNSLPECQSISITAPGVWYSFIPDATRFVQARLDDLKGSVTVYSGSCDSLQCVAADSSGKAMWTASKGEKYLIFVHGAGNKIGDFSLSVLAGGLLRPPAGTNSQCVLSQPLETPTLGKNISVTNTTVYGLAASETPGCGELFDPSVAPGLWYSVIGNGTGIRASTCDTVSGFIARVAVYSGDCQNLVCIDGGDQNCGEESSVAWIGEAGKEYFVLVEGLDSRVGEFNLTLEKVALQSSSDCASPVTISLDEVAILGSTEDGTFHDVELCSGIAFSPPSVWYTVEGTGNAMFASTCDSKSDAFAKLEIYAGNCGSLECRTFERFPCGNQMISTWDSVHGEKYLLQIYGSAVPGDGDFTLDVEELPSNHECTRASDDLVLGSSVRGSTVLFSSNVSVCSDATESGSWYKITVPSEQRVTLSTCSGNTNFQTKLTIMQGDSCGLSSCVGTNNGKSCGDGSTVTWSALASRSYYVLVQGAAAFETGNFHLQFGVENDSCNTALGSIIVGGSPVRGTTLFATVDEGALGCFSSSLSNDGPGIWYTVTGIDSYLKASTCSTLTTFDTRISIYEGRCEALNCIAGNDDDDECGDASSVIWYAAEGEVYYILVHGAEQGDFALEVTVVENNSCLTSQPIFIQGDSNTVFGRRSVSEAFLDDCSGEVATNQIGAWFSVSGTGGPIRLDGCELGTLSDSSLSVYSEDCESLACVADSGSGCSVVVDTTFGQNYSVYLETRSDESTLPLELDVYASNDNCSSAFGPLKHGDVIRGSTVDATVDTVSLCGDVMSRGAGVWYTLIGTGETLTAFTCSEFTNFDTQMTLYRDTGEGCGNLECVASRDDNCGTSTWIEHEFTKGNRYYILVSGKPGPKSVGNFELHFQ